MAAFTSIALFALGVGLSAWQQKKAGDSAKKAGMAEKEAAFLQARLLDWNALVADYQAADAIARGAEEERRFREGIAGLIGEQRATFAAGNIQVGYGSALEVQAESAYLGELDALQLRTNAAREAWGYSVEATDYRAQAEITRRTGVMRERQGREVAKQYGRQMWGTVLGGAADLLPLGVELGGRYRRWQAGRNVNRALRGAIFT